MIGIIRCGHDGRRAVIYGMAVERKSRGQGIGKLLVKKVVAGLRRHQIVKCHLLVDKRNRNANRFWRKQGWIQFNDHDNFTRRL
jgi:ribosomal protein S18 acetylase RimI-like enzyme